MLASEYRVHEIKRGHLIAAPLDGTSMVRVSVPSACQYIENEIVILTSLEEARPGLKAHVIASRRDPSFLKVKPLELYQVSDREFELEEYPSSADAEEFEEALELYRAEYFREAAGAIRYFLKRFPLHIDSYHHLGTMEWKQGRHPRALKYYEMGHRIALCSLPADFSGQLCWSRPGNRPFLRATHAYALLLSRQRRLLEACKLCERLLAWDPSDRLGVRELLPRYYFEANAPEQARVFLASRPADGMNFYTLGLLELMEGRRRDAVRSLCAAVTYNPYVPIFLLAERTAPAVDADAEYVTVGSEEEAAEYLSDFGAYWRRGRYVDFLRLLMRPGSPFRRRFDRYLALKEELDRIRDFSARDRLIAEKQKILNEDDVRALLREAADTIFQ